MSQVSKNLKKGVSPGMRSLINFINSHNKAKIVEISKEAVPFKTDLHDPNYEFPVDNMTKIYA